MTDTAFLEQARRDARAIAKLPPDVRARLNAETDWNGYHMRAYRRARD